MVWFLYALLAPLLFAFVNIFDKLLRDKHLSTFTASVAVGLAAFWILAIVPFIDLHLTPLIVLVGFAAGALFFANAFPYFNALAIKEVSRVIPLWAFEAPIVLILAFVFLKERLVVNDYVGFVLVVAGAFFISAKNVGSLPDILRPGKAFFLMLLAAAMTSIGIVLTKWLFTQISFWAVQVLIDMGAGISALLTLALSAKKKVFFTEMHRLKSSGKSLFSSGLFHLAMRQLSFIAGGLFFTLAIMVGSASLSTALVQLSGFFVFIMATLLSRFLPHILKEAIDKKTLLTKAVAIVMIIAGVFAINL